MTQPQIILKLLESQPEVWFKGYQLRGRDTPWGFCGHQADRRARELAESGAIEVRHGKYAEYKYKNLFPVHIGTATPPQRTKYTDNDVRGALKIVEKFSGLQTSLGF